MTHADPDKIRYSGFYREIRSDTDEAHVARDAACMQSGSYSARLIFNIALNVDTVPMQTVSKGGRGQRCDSSECQSR